MPNFVLRTGTEHDLAWAPRFILDGFEHHDYVPSFDRILMAIRACIYDGIGLVAEHDGRPVGLLGAFVLPIFWAERNEATICALRSTHPGAGFALLNRFRAIVRERPDIKQVVFNFAPENTDPRIDRLMSRWGARPMRSFLIQQ